MSTISTGLAKKLIQNYAQQKIGTQIQQHRNKSCLVLSKRYHDCFGDAGKWILPNGLRFYFAAYEAFDPTRPPRYKEDQEKITLVIVPTTHMMDTTGHIIMHPYRTVDKEILPFDLLEDPDALPAYDTHSFKEGNDGQICPPPASLL